MYRHILLAVALQQWEGFSPHALAARGVAVTLAKGAGARLSVLSVYTYDLQTLQTPPPSLEMEMPGHYAVEAMHQVEAVRKVQEDHMRQLDVAMAEKMKAFLAVVPVVDVPITPVLKEGEPRAQIIYLAETLGTDLIVIGAHSKRSFLDVLLGGTAAYVSRHAPCPVLMVHPRQRRLIAQSSEVGESLQATQAAQPA